MAMGTANSVQSMAEALGLTLPGCASIPAVYAQRIHMAEATAVLLTYFRNNAAHLLVAPSLVACCFLRRRSVRRSAIAWA